MQFLTFFFLDKGYIAIIINSRYSREASIAANQLKCITRASSSNEIIALGGAARAGAVAHAQLEFRKGDLHIIRPILEYILSTLILCQCRSRSNFGGQGSLMGARLLETEVLHRVLGVRITQN